MTRRAVFPSTLVDERWHSHPQVRIKRLVTVTFLAQADRNIAHELA
jgi:hypothetical protein